MKDLFNVSSSPHDRDAGSSRTIMADVCIALAPAAIYGCFQFGARALVILLASIAAAVLSEYLWKRFALKEKEYRLDFSAVVTGLLIGMNMPASIPVWIPVLGSVFAILVVKEFFGGLGQNFMNPALAARCFLVISFAGRMTDFAVAKGGSVLWYGRAALDGISSATPLNVIKNMEAGTTLAQNGISIKEMFFGYTGGVIGETSAFLIICGALYMLILKVINIRIPAAYIISFSVFMLLFGGHGFNMAYLAAELCGGGLMLGAFFMATDYVTSPITKWGQVIFGICCGLLTGVIRVCSNSAEGVSFAIIFCNLLVPLIEKLTLPKAFGREGKKNA